MQAIHQKLQDTIQTLYRKAVDADQALDHCLIFLRDSVF